ncbi:MAG: hypothetical protein JNM72_20195 [Deltaproteobacteria bacterium]|jgi:hypothetical protein|nr:hypothetical protein [Deltaproteobacteria bacterium]
MSTSSPHAPPTASLDHPPPAAGGGGGAGPRTAVDIGEALKYPFADPDWPRCYAIMGLIVLVPLLGFFVQMGWQVHVAERVRAGTPGLPGLDFWPQLSAGFKLFISVFSGFLVSVIALIGLHVLVWKGCSSINALIFEESGAQGFLDPAFVSVVLLTPVYTIYGFFTNLVIPEVHRRGFAGELLPFASPGPSIRRIRRAPVAFFMAGIGVMAATWLASLGATFCLAGLIFLIPPLYVATAHLVCQWEAVSGGPDIAV